MLKWNEQNKRFKPQDKIPWSGVQKERGGTPNIPRLVSPPIEISSPPLQRMKERTPPSPVQADKQIDKAGRNKNTNSINSIMGSNNNNTQRTVFDKGFNQQSESLAVSDSKDISSSQADSSLVAGDILAGDDGNGKHQSGGQINSAMEARHDTDMAFVLRNLYTGGGLDAQQQGWDSLPNALFNTLTMQLGTMSKVQHKKRTDRQYEGRTGTPGGGIQL